MIHKNLGFDTFKKFAIQFDYQSLLEENRKKSKAFIKISYVFRYSANLRESLTRFSKTNQLKQIETIGPVIVIHNI